MTSSRASFVLLLAAVGGACSNAGVPSGPRGGFDFAGSSNDGSGGSTGGASSGGNTTVGMGGKLGTGGASGGTVGAGGSKIGSGGTGIGGASMGGSGGAALGGAKATGGYGPVMLTAGLIGHWKFDEATVGATAMDSSIGANHGTFSTSKPERSTDVPTPLAGKSTACLTFDGNPNNAPIGNDIVLPAAPFSGWTNTVSFSISVWVKVATFKGWVGIIGNESAIDPPPVPTPNYCGLYISGDQPALASEIVNAFSFETNDITPATVAKVVTLDTWHHVALVQDATRAQSIYVDGVAAPGTRAPQICSSSNPFHIGSPNGTGGFFQGSLDDVRFYNRALSPPEVAALYAGQQ